MGGPRATYHVVEELVLTLQLAASTGATLDAENWILGAEKLGGAGGYRFRVRDIQRLKTDVFGVEEFGVRWFPCAHALHNITYQEGA